MLLYFLKIYCQTQKAVERDHRGLLEAATGLFHRRLTFHLLEMKSIDLIMKRIKRPRLRSLSLEMRLKNTSDSGNCFYYPLISQYN